MYEEPSVQSEPREQRKEDPIIVAIHARLDVLEGLAPAFIKFEKWVDTVTAFTALMDKVICFFGKWAMRFIRISIVISLGWAMLKGNVKDIKDNWSLILKVFK